MWISPNQSQSATKSAPVIHTRRLFATNLPHSHSPLRMRPRGREVAVPLPPSRRAAPPAHRPLLHLPSPGRRVFVGIPTRVEKLGKKGSKKARASSPRLATGRKHPPECSLPHGSSQHPQRSDRSTPKARSWRRSSKRRAGAHPPRWPPPGPGEREQDSSNAEARETSPIELTRIALKHCFSVLLSGDDAQSTPREPADP